METFFSHRRYRWFWINLIAIVILTAVYFIDQPIGGRSGSTWVGYIYGFIATAAILYLMWFGVRKRSYTTSSNTLKGCLSAHVWLGVSMAIVVPLHAGFAFDWNIHSLAYLLMLIVVISGIYGAVNYVRLAPLIAAHRGGGHSSELLDGIQRLSRDISSHCKGKSDDFLKLVRAADFEIQPTLWTCCRGRLVPKFDSSSTSELLAKLDSSEQGDGLKVVSLTARKRELGLRLQQDVRLLTILKLWLWVHLPFSLALVVCVAAHIVIVFMYR